MKNWCGIGAEDVTETRKTIENKGKIKGEYRL